MSDRDVAWRYRPWSELTTGELYRIMTLRQRVFVVEQSCPYLDADGKDDRAHHLWCDDAAGQACVAYLRVFAPGVVYAEASLGRIVTAPEVRRSGLGRPLVREGLARIAAAHGAVPVRIGAQKYLEPFYAGLGFVRASDDYLEDGIPHLEMVRA
ncbi:MAG: GNAT family N-acetyltransferase [Deltaproteobacteria bacterium]|nr:GNAT family N-acetyltransferase [Kofleriaceae bacterium]